MTFIKQRPLTTVEKAEYEDHLLEVHLDGLWEQFLITRHPATLASFVRLGGDITDQKTRDLIANHLDKVTFKHSRAKPNLKIDFFMAVRNLLRQGTKDDNGKPISEAEAIRRTADNVGVSEKAGITRFSAGKALVGG